MGGDISHQAVIDRYLPLIEEESVDFLGRAVDAIVESKRKGQKGGGDRQRAESP